MLIRYRIITGKAAHGLCRYHPQDRGKTARVSRAGRCADDGFALRVHQATLTSARRDRLMPAFFARIANDRKPQSYLAVSTGGRSHRARSFAADAGSGGRPVVAAAVAVGA